MACPHLHAGGLDPHARFSQCEELWQGAYPSPLGLTSYCGHCSASGLRGLRPAPTGAVRGPSFPMALRHLHTHVHTPEVAAAGGELDQWRKERWRGVSPHPRRRVLGGKRACSGDPRACAAAPSSGQQHSLSLLDHLTECPPTSRRLCRADHPAPSGTSGRYTEAGLWPRLGSRRALPRKRRVSCALKQEWGSSGQRGRDCRGEEEHVQRPRGSPGCELSWSRARHEPSRAETPRGTREPQKSLSEILLNAQGRVDPALAPEEAGPVGG